MIQYDHQQAMMNQDCRHYLRYSYHWMLKTGLPQLNCSMKTDVYGNSYVHFYTLFEFYYCPDQHEHQPPGRLKENFNKKITLLMNLSEQDTYMTPITFTAHWQAFITFHQQYTSIAYFSLSRIFQIKTLYCIAFIFTRIGET